MVIVWVLETVKTIWLELSELQVFGRSSELELKSQPLFDFKVKV